MLRVLNPFLCVFFLFQKVSCDSVKKLILEIEILLSAFARNNFQIARLNTWMRENIYNRDCAKPKITRDEIKMVFNFEQKYKKINNNIILLNNHGSLSV